MSSFISRFKSFFPGHPKRQLAFFALALIATVSLSAIYTLYLNPENAFFSKVRSASLAWGKSLDDRFDSKYIISGGSSTTVAVIPELLLDEYNLPVVNAGFHAGFGYGVLNELALDAVNPGDTLIVAMEPSLLMNDKKTKTMLRTSEGDKFFFCVKGAPYSGVFYSTTWQDLPSLLFGSTSTNFFLLGKVVLGRPLYRYDVAHNLREHGGMKITEKGFLQATSGEPSEAFLKDPLTAEAREYLSLVKNWAEKNNVKVMYSLPKSYAEESYRPVYARYLLAISEYMPVLKDECLGCYDVLEEFSDTGNHLTPEGAVKATRELARELIYRDFWTKEELLIVIDQEEPQSE